MKTSILWLTENYPPQRGGMSQSCDRIVSNLRSLGYLIHIVHLTPKGGVVERTQHINGSCLVVPLQDSEAQTLHLAWHHIKAQKFDLLVCFGGYLPILAAPVYASWLSIPLVTLLRGNDFDTAIFTPRKRDLLRDACETARVVCSVSSDKIDKIRALFKVRDVRFLANGIDSREWRVSDSDRRFALNWRLENVQDKLCLGLFGQLKAKKGLHFLLESMEGSMLVKEYYLLLVGDIQEESLSLLQGMGISFSVLPFLDRYQLPRYYAACDAMVIPSFYDGMPNVLLEAGALGIPVIASAVDGMKDVIRHNQNGLLFSAADHAALRKALFDFYELKNDERSELGKNLKRTIDTDFTETNETNRYDELFKEILLDRGSAVRLHNN